MVSMNTEPDEVSYKRVLRKLHDDKTAQPMELAKDLEGVSLQEVYRCLNKAKRDGYILQGQGGRWTWVPGMTPLDVVSPLTTNNTGSTQQIASPGRPGVEDTSKYMDWSGLLPRLQRQYRLKTPTLLVGSKGTGKTEGILHFARTMNIPVYTVPCSLGLREFQFIGRLDRDASGAITFKKGPLPLSMETGGILYLDELSAAEADVLVRLDEALDSRRELNVEGETIIADEKWWCVASINPLDHAGTKELPPQLMSRFTARLQVIYPPSTDEEYRIVEHRLNLKGNISTLAKDNLMSLIELIRDLRLQGGDLFYTPSVRESICCGKMLMDNAPLRETVEVVILGAYSQWGDGALNKAQDFVVSKLGRNY